MTVVAKASVLFVCTGNSCRSQMAEGLLRHLAGDRFEVASGGTRPAGLCGLPIGSVLLKIQEPVVKVRQKCTGRAREGMR